MDCIFVHENLSTVSLKTIFGGGMRKFLILFGLVFTGLLSSESYITYEFFGGRFGDCLLSYLHAKWLSYKYQLPLLYKPFKYSSDLCLDAKEQLIHPILTVSIGNYSGKIRLPILGTPPVFTNVPIFLKIRLIGGSTLKDTASMWIGKTNSSGRWCAK